MYFKDYKEIEMLLQKYFKAVEEADIAILKTIFHEKASMYGYLGKDYVLGTPEIFYSDLSSKPSMKEPNTDCKMVIGNINVTGNIATACIYVDNFFDSFRVNDYFHLLKINNEWKIVCKTFTTI